MLSIIASNFLKLGNGWTIVEKNAATVAYVETHSFPQFVFPKTLDLIVMHVVSQFPRKKTHLLNKKGTDISTENMSGIMDNHQN